MTQKRLRSEFESDFNTHQHSYVVYGTPLPLVDSGIQDDGSYVPVWKQEVKDERGRKRLHGAFTGGFSAGYFNTVGSKEGWTPSSFVSSRTNKRKDEQATEHDRRTQYMDEEDLADVAEAQVLYTNNEFQSLGFTADDHRSVSHPERHLGVADDNIGLRLLQKMGWNHTRRTEVFGEQPYLERGKNNPTAHIAAARIMRVYAQSQQPSRRGLGFANNNHLERPFQSGTEQQDESCHPSSSTHVLASKLKKSSNKQHKAFTRFISDDIDSDDDTSAMGPRIKYNRGLVSDPKSKKINLQDKRSAKSANPLIKSKLLYQPGKHYSLVSNSKKGTDGKPSLKGFSLAETLDESIGPNSTRYLPSPVAPESWTAPRSSTGIKAPDYRLANEAATTSKLNPKSRADLLGETTLPGKSVFDFISSESRDRLAQITGRDDLPTGLGEVPVQTQLSDQTTETTLPPLDKEVALAALGRGMGGWMPYAENEEKRARYRAFMEYCAGIRLQLPQAPSTMTKDSFLQELREFSQAAAVFKPMSGMMASRFSSASSPLGDTTGKEAPQPSSTAPQAKPEDSAEAAARLGMFGPLTRHSYRFFPLKLVCKRFNIPPPAHVDDNSSTVDHSQARTSTHTQTSAFDLGPTLKKNVAYADIDDVRKELAGEVLKGTEAEATHEAKGATEASLINMSTIDPSYNAAIETEKAGEALFQAVFGDDSDSS